MADIFSEIDDELRDEKLRLFWKEYGTWIISMIVLSIAVTGFVSAWGHYSVNRDTKHTTELVKAVYSNNVAQLLSYAEDTGKNHAALAKFMAAAQMADQGDREQALSLYHEIADMGGVDDLYRDLASLRAVTLQIGQAGVDVDGLERQLSTFDHAGSPWRFMALEQKALLYASVEKFDQAASALTILLGLENVPPALRVRAETLKELYVVQQAQKMT